MMSCSNPIQRLGIPVVLQIHFFLFYYCCTVVVFLMVDGPSRSRGQNCELSKTRYIKKPATGLFAKEQNLVADRQTSKMSSEQAKLNQILNLGQQKRGSFDSEMN